MRVFKRVLCEKRIEALVIEGIPPLIELQTAWAGIIEEFNNATITLEQQHYISLLRDTQQAEATLSAIEGLITTLKKYYATELADELNKLLRIRFVFDPANKEDYLAKLKNCFNRSRGIMLDLELKKQEIQALEKRLSGEDSNPSVEYFDRVLISLSDHAGYRLTDDITVFEYCTRLNSYLEIIRQQKRK